MKILITLFTITIIHNNIIKSNKWILKDSILSNTLDFIRNSYYKYVKDKWSSGTDYEIIMMRVKKEKGGEHIDKLIDYFNSVFI